MTAVCIIISICISMAFYNACGIILECINRNNKKKHGVLGEHEDSVTSGYISEYMRHDRGVGIKGTMNNQIVYKVDGDFNGDIKGNNVTVILMGDGNLNGNIESKDGNVVLIKGNINGNVKANKVVCPTNHNEKNCFECIVDITKHNPAKDVESPKLPVKTLWSCDIPQGTSPRKIIDHYSPIGNCVSVYGSSPVAHITCPHCRKHFATQLRVQTSVVDGDVVETSVEEMRHDY